MDDGTKEQDLKMAIKYSVTEGVATFIIDNGRLNLFTMAMHEQLHGFLLEFLNDETAKVGVITGSEENFSAGDDLRESDTSVKARSKPRWDEMTMLLPRKKPIIAAVNGYCFGQGLLYLMNLTDIRVAGTNLCIGAPEIAYGMGGMSGGTHMGSQLPYVHAAYLSLTGDKFDATDAMRFNLVNEVVPSADSFARAQDIAKRIAAHPLVAIQTEMDCLQRSTDLSRLDSLRHTMNQYQIQRRLHLQSGATALGDLAANTNKGADA